MFYKSSGNECDVYATLFLQIKNERQKCMTYEKKHKQDPCVYAMPHATHQNANANASIIFHTKSHPSPFTASASEITS